jgi:hypothetical protein
VDNLLGYAKSYPTGNTGGGPLIFSVGNIGELMRSRLTGFGVFHRAGRIARRLYQPKTATAYWIWMPPWAVRCSWRPAADLKRWTIAGRWDARPQRFDDLNLSELAPSRLT